MNVNRYTCRQLITISETVNNSFTKKYELLSEAEKQGLLDNIQAALDVIGFEPTFGSIADGANVLISALRAALAKEKDQRKKHLINAAISAVSLIPFADIIKGLKLKKFVSPDLLKKGIKGAKAVKKGTEMVKKQGGRFDDESKTLS